MAGEELTSYLADVRRRKYLHPELQAEIKFGMWQSKETTSQDLRENFETFLTNGEEWEKINQHIVSSRKNMSREIFPAVEDLGNVTKFEIEFQEHLWQSDFENALENAGRVLGGLVSPELRGYRALWHYLAGGASWLGSEEGISRLKEKARFHFSEAKKAAQFIPWLVGLAREQTPESPSISDNAVLMEQIQRVEAILEKFGTSHDRKFDGREKDILEGLSSDNSAVFENAHKLLGELLGFKADNVETDGAPDPWWISGKVCLVFEDHSAARETSILDVKKARQVSCHSSWIQENGEIDHDTEILPVLVTPVRKVKRGAVVHLRKVALWPLDEFVGWAKDAVSIVRELRKTFFEVGDLAWRAEAAEKFESNKLDAQGLISKLRSRIAADELEVQ